MKKTLIETNSCNFEAEVADNFLRRMWGLSLRRNGKMLFKFPRKTSAKIDMALLSKKLHLYFINENKEIIKIQEASPWTWNPKTWNLYSPSQKYKYLLESFEKLDLEKGDKLRFSEDYKD